MMKKQTPSQTIGPYFAYGLTPKQYGYDFTHWVDYQMAEGITGRETIEITGAVYDGKGDSIEDALIELWQDDGEHRLFGRYGTGTAKGNKFMFKTIKPKSIRGQAPYIELILFMRGQLLHSYTRIYFSDETALNAQDDLLRTLATERRDTLIAKKGDHGYVFDIHMQGPKETVFLDL